MMALIISNTFFIQFEIQIKRFAYAFLFLAHSSMFAQETAMQEALVSSYDSYARLPQEIAYLHTNKTTFLQGEQLGFSAYILDKHSKTLSTTASNLYVTLSDNKNHVLKKQLLKITGGSTYGSFALDSLVGSGSYILKAYTNWMNNFETPNFYAQAIEVLDVNPKSEVQNVKNRIGPLDIQFFPEGGHLVNKVESTVGVTIKDSLGFGIPKSSLYLYNSENRLLDTIKTNRFGLGKFSLVPEANQTYYATHTKGSNDMMYNLPLVKDIGIRMQIIHEGSGISLQLATNEKSLERINNKECNLLIHNGKNYKILPLPFFSTKAINKIIPQELLFPGINIFTLLDNANQPLCERIVFNHFGIPFNHIRDVKAKVEGDSLTVAMAFGSQTQENTKLSISVLPKASKAYNKHHDIISYSLLRPYVNGTIEDGRYYFTKVDSEKKAMLDVLLLTQGWSSYHWGSIREFNPEPSYTYENGISAIINHKVTTVEDFICYPSGGDASQFFQLTPEQPDYAIAALFPRTKEKLKISQLGKKGKVMPPNVSVVFEPNSIPDLIPKVFNLLGAKPLVVSDPVSLRTKLVVDNGVELEEVVLTAKRKRSRLEVLQSTSNGRVEAIDKSIAERYLNFQNYVREKGYFAELINGTFILNSRIPNFYGYPEPRVYLDGVPLNNPIRNGEPGSGLGILYGLELSDIDYIDINKSGLGESFNSGGVIRIYTRTGNGPQDVQSKAENYKEFEYPLVFNTGRTFYVPKYSSYENSLYQFYGTVDWQPDLRINKSGRVLFKFAHKGVTELQLWIEGIGPNGAYISESLQLCVN